MTLLHQFISMICEACNHRNIKFHEISIKVKEVDVTKKKVIKGALE